MVILSGCADHNDTHTKYQPLMFDGHGLVVKASLISREHFNRVEHVLTYYRIEYTRTGETEISFKTSLGADYMWNMTNKAENKDWLTEHPLTRKQ